MSMSSSPKPVRKVVLPVAGLGTRFLPATKTIPKEMLPIVDIPTVQLNVEECVADLLVGAERATPGDEKSRHAI